MSITPSPLVTTTAYCTGCFDALHPSHLMFLRRAAATADRLVVGLTTDERMGQEKRPPLIDYGGRREMLMALPFVHDVVPHSGQTKTQAWHQHRFDVLVTGEEYRGSEEFRAAESELPHVRIVYLSRDSRYSTTHLINRAVWLTNVGRLQSPV